MNKPKKGKRLTAFFLAILMVVSSIFACPSTTVEAAAKPKLVKKSGNVVIGGTQNIKIKNAPKGMRIYYKSNKPSVATVSKKGKVSGIKAGTAKIAVTMKKGNRKTKLTYKLTVKKPCLKVKNVPVTIGGSTLLELKNKPKKAKYTWSSSDKNIATVNKNGEVTGKNEGNATIKVKLTSGKKFSYTLSTTVTVVAANTSNLAVNAGKTYTVKFNSNGGSSVSSQTVEENQTVSRPDNPTRDRYKFVGWYDNPELTSAYDFSTKLTSDIVLYAKWEARNYCNISIMASYGGSVNAESGEYEIGKPVSLTATADQKWKFIEWKSTDGGAFSNINLQKTNFVPEKDTSVIAVFEKENQSEINKDELAVENAYYALSIQYEAGDYENSVTQNVGLITEYGETNDDKVNIIWSSSDDDIITAKGQVIRPVQDENVILTAKISKNAYSKEKQFRLTVKKKVDVKSDDITENNIINITEMNKDAEQPVEIEYNADGDKVESIDGKFSDVLVDSSETALNSICSVKSLIGLESPADELDNQAQNHDDTTVSYTFSQKYKDIPVYGTSVTVASDVKNNEVHSLHSSVISTEKLKNMELSPSLSEEEIKNLFPGAISCSLCIYGIKDYKDNPILAYLITTEAETIIANADNGKAVYRFRNKCEWGDYSTTGSGKDENGNKVTFPVRFHQFDFYFYYQEDIERQIFLKGDKSSSITHEFNTTWGDKTANSAYTNTIKAYDWYKEHLNRNSIDNNGMKIIVNVHEKGSWNNAWWDGSSITFCDNDSSKPQFPTTANGLDIIAHEMTHGVLEKVIMQDHPGEASYNVFPYADETGAINEGYADVFGYLVDNEDWIVGEDWKAGGIRSLSNPEKFNAPVTLDDPNLFKVTADPGTEPDEYNQQQSALVHTNSSLIYHAAYLMSTYGITNGKLEKLWYSSMSKGYDATSDYHTVRRNLIKAAKDNNFSDNEIAAVRKAFDTEKIYAETGTLKINFLDTAGKRLTIEPDKAIKYSLIRKRKNVPTETYSDSQLGGSYIQQNKIYFGEYEAEITIPGYVPFKGIVTIEEGKLTEINVTFVEAGNGKVGGIITSATTGKPVADVNLCIRSGWNTKFGETIGTGTSDENGSYQFELPAGYYTLEMSKTEYSTGYLNLYVEGGMNKPGENASISPSIKLGNKIRVVLTWNENPEDLDSHLIGSYNGKYDYHIYFNDPEGYDENDNLVAELDVDETTGYGPETVTFTMETNGSYEYFVDWYDGFGTWATSGAKVEVYSGNSNEPVYVFEVPNWDYDDEECQQWNVFTYQNGILKRSY